MYLGIEIGGTKLQLGLGRGDGTLAALHRATVDVAAGPAGIRRQITAAIPDLLRTGGIGRDQVFGAGVGFGGPVDDATRIVIKSHQIEGWDDFPLAQWLSEMTGWPAVLGNDADVAGLAEALYGAGKNLSPIFYVTVGSGIGGGLIIRGEIYRGCGRGAAEVGHLQFKVCRQDSHPSLDSPSETLEQLASGWGIAQMAARRVREERPIRSPLYSRLEQKGELTAKDVVDAALQGDAFAESVLSTAVGFLADGICHVIALLSPRRIVLGGGVSLIGEQLFFEPLRALVAKRVFPPFADCYDIVPAALGEEVVVHGAIALAKRHFDKPSATPERSSGPSSR
jgi:glucokinase